MNGMLKVAAVDFTDPYNIKINVISEEGWIAYPSLRDLLAEEEGVIQFKNLGMDGPYLQLQIEEMRLFRTKSRKPKTNEYNMIGNVINGASTKDNGVVAITFEKVKFECLARRAPDNWDIDIKDLLEMARSFQKAGLLDRMTASSSGLNFIKRHLPESRYRFRYNDQMYLEPNKNGEVIFDKSYLGKSGKISKSARAPLLLIGANEYNGRSTTIDVNSLYSYIVVNCKVPQGVPTRIESSMYNYFSRISTCSLLLQVKIKARVKEGVIPWFQIVAGDGKSAITLSFIDDIYYMWNDELLFLQETYNIEVLEPIEILRYNAYVGGYKGKMDKTCPATGLKEMYELKEASEGYERLAYKLMLNGTMGKMFQNPSKSENFITPWYQEEVLENEYKIEHNKTYMAMKSFLYCQSRLFVLRTIQRIGWDKFLYSDTDSITFKGESPKWLDIGTAMGQWKEESINHRFRCIAPKVYAKETTEGDVFKFAGVTRGATSSLTFDEFVPGTRLISKVIKWDERGVPYKEDKHVVIGGITEKKDVKAYIEERVNKVRIKYGDEAAQEEESRLYEELEFDF